MSGGRAHKRVPSFTDQQLITLNKKGLNDREIAEELGVPRKTVSRRRMKLGLKAHGRRLLFTDQQLIELHEQVWNDTEIGEKLGVAPSAVNQRRIKLGLKSHGRRRLFTDQQLIELHERGLNDREIGEKLGAERSIVSRYRRRLGLKPVQKLGLKSHGRRRLFTDQQLIDLHEKGLNDREIGDRFGVTRSAVNYRRSRLGLESNYKTKGRLVADV